MLVAQAVRASEFFRSIPADDRRIASFSTSSARTKKTSFLPECRAAGKVPSERNLHRNRKRVPGYGDALIEEKAGKKISEIFANMEKHISGSGNRSHPGSFKEQVRSLLPEAVVLRQENVDALKLNGRIFYIDRPVHMLIPTDDRWQARKRSHQTSGIENAKQHL